MSQAGNNWQLQSYILHTPKTTDLIYLCKHFKVLDIYTNILFLFTHKEVFLLKTIQETYIFYSAANSQYATNKRWNVLEER